MPNDTPEDHPALKEAVIISMLGGPGSGKGTQCQMLSERFDFAHISIGDVLRQEIDRPGSQYADILREDIMAGRIGAKEMTVSILRDEMLRIVAQGTRCFVLDGIFPILRVSKSKPNLKANFTFPSGFPRSKVPCDYFEQLVCPIALLIVLDCPESTMMARLAVADRNRPDDNTTSIKKRIEVFQETTSEVIDDFRCRDKLRTVNSDQESEVVVLELEAILSGLVPKRIGASLDSRDSMAVVALPILHPC